MKKVAIFIAVVFFILMGLAVFAGVGKAGISLSLYDNEERVFYKTYEIKGGGLLRYLLFCRANGKEFYRKYSSSGDREMLSILNDKLYDDLADTAKSLKQEKIQSEISWSDEKSDFVYNVGKDGVWVNESELIRAVIENFSTNINVTVPKNYDRAESLDELKQRTVMRGQFSTTYAGSAENRKKNIRRAVSLLHNKRLPPGAIFSFNDTVGERSEKNGFYPATIILNGSFVSGVGGGVCQVSTTLFNAWLLSGLDVVYSRAHSLPVSYVPPSRDAMVSSDNDLILKNTGESEIFVVAFADDSRCVFTVYGEKQNERVELKSQTEKVLQSGEFEEIEDYGINWAENETRRIVALPKAGLISESRRIFYDEGGAILVEERIRRDVYAPQKGKVVIRQKEAEDIALDANEERAVS